VKAVRLEKFGDPADLKVADIAAPQPAGDEALVRVLAASINPSDLSNVMGRFAQTKLPRTIGRDFAGVVESGPTEWRGAEVFGTGGDLGFTREGTHAELVAVPIAALTRRPGKLSVEGAASVGVTYITAYSALRRAKLSAGETVLIVGAGGVGHAAVQIGKWLNARTIVTAKDGADAQRAKATGADHVVVLGERPLPEAVRAITGQGGANVCFNTVGGPTFEPGLLSLAPSGRLVVIAANVEKRVGLDLMHFYRQELVMIGLNTSHLDAVACATLLGEMSEGFASGALAPPPTAEHYPLADAVKAYQRQASKQVKGKIVLRMS